MGSTEPDARGLGTDFPGAVARALLRVIVSSDRREEFEGDLIEEAEAIVLPGAEYYFMTLVLIPISIAQALVTGAGKASETTAAEAV